MIRFPRIHHGWSVEIGKSQPEGPSVPVGNRCQSQKRCSFDENERESRLYPMNSHQFSLVLLNIIAASSCFGVAKQCKIDLSTTAKIPEFFYLYDRGM